MNIFRPLHGFTRMFQRLFGMLVPGLMVLFLVVHRGGSVRVCREFVKFGGSLLRVVWHDSPITLWWGQLRGIPFSVLFTIEQPVLVGTA